MVGQAVMTEKLRIMRFIESEFDQACLIRLAGAPAHDRWPSRPAPADFSRPAIRLPLRRLGEGAVRSGMPALVIPFLFSLGGGASLGWPLIPLSLAALPLALWWFYRDAPGMRLGQAEERAGLARLTAGRSPGGTGRLSVLGNTGLTALLIAAAADHAAAAIASLAIGESAEPIIAGKESMAGLALSFAAALASAAWLLARRGATPPLRVMAVIEGITLALTLIVLANYAALGGASLESQPTGTPSGGGAVTIAAAAQHAGLAALSPILSAGIAFCCFAGALASLKRASLKRVERISATFRPAAGSLG